MTIKDLYTGDKSEKPNFIRCFLRIKLRDLYNKYNEDKKQKLNDYQINIIRTIISNNYKNMNITLHKKIIELIDKTIKFIDLVKNNKDLQKYFNNIFNGIDKIFNDINTSDNYILLIIENLINIDFLKKPNILVLFQNNINIFNTLVTYKNTLEAFQNTLEAFQKELNAEKNEFINKLNTLEAFQKELNAEKNEFINKLNTEFNIYLKNYYDMMKLYNDLCKKETITKLFKKTEFDDKLYDPIEIIKKCNTYKYQDNNPKYCDTYKYKDNNPKYCDRIFYNYDKKFEENYKIENIKYNTFIHEKLKDLSHNIVFNSFEVKQTKGITEEKISNKDEPIITDLTGGAKDDTVKILYITIYEGIEIKLAQDDIINIYNSMRNEMNIYDHDIIIFGTQNKKMDLGNKIANNIVKSDINYKKYEIESELSIIQNSNKLIILSRMKNLIKNDEYHSCFDGKCSNKFTHMSFYFSGYLSSLHINIVNIHASRDNNLNDIQILFNHLEKINKGKTGILNILGGDFNFKHDSIYINKINSMNLKEADIQIDLLKPTNFQSYPIPFAPTCYIDNTTKTKKTKNTKTYKLKSFNN